MRTEEIAFGSRLGTTLSSQTSNSSFEIPPLAKSFAVIVSLDSRSNFSYFLNSPLPLRTGSTFPVADFDDSTSGSSVLSDFYAFSVSVSILTGIDIGS